MRQATAFRRQRGVTAHHGGAAAEGSVEREYCRRGADVAGRRFRGQGGEIDLILRHGEEVIFVEVKKARDFGAAATRVGLRQMQRIAAAASEFLAGEPRGQLTPARFDVALVDSSGGLEIIENAFGCA